MKQLSKKHETHIVTLEEVVESGKINYQYQLDTFNPTIHNVAFNYEGNNGKRIEGSYHVNGGLNIKGQGLVNATDFQVVGTALETAKSIIAGNFTLQEPQQEEQNEQGNEDTNE